MMHWMLGDDAAFAMCLLVLLALFIVNRASRPERCFIGRGVSAHEERCPLKQDEPEE